MDLPNYPCDPGDTFAYQCQDHLLHLQPSCGEDDGQEVRTDQGKAFLPVRHESVRIFPMGPRRDCPSSAIPDSTDASGSLQFRPCTGSAREPAFDSQGRVGKEGEGDPGEGRGPGHGTRGGQELHERGDPAEPVHAAGAGGEPEEVPRGPGALDAVVAGEERMHKAMNDPAFHQETVAQAMEFRRQIDQQPK